MGSQAVLRFPQEHSHVSLVSWKCWKCLLSQCGTLESVTKAPPNPRPKLVAFEVCDAMHSRMWCFPLGSFFRAVTLRLATGIQ